MPDVAPHTCAYHCHCSLLRHCHHSSPHIHHIRSPHPHTRIHCRMSLYQSECVPSSTRLVLWVQRSSIITHTHRGEPGYKATIMCVGDVCKPIHSSMFNWDTSHYEVNTYMHIQYPQNGHPPERYTYTEIGHIKVHQCIKPQIQLEKGSYFIGRGSRDRHTLSVTGFLKRREGDVYSSAQCLFILFEVL